MRIIQEFHEFALKGNFLDLATGVIIGAASGKVVSSIVEQVVMPPIGLLLGKVRFDDLKLVLQSGVKGPDGKEVVKEVAIGYGAAAQAFIDFLVVAVIVFLVVRAYNRFRSQATAEPSAQEKLLAEIRDLLRAGSRTGG